MPPREIAPDCTHIWTVDLAARQPTDADWAVLSASEAEHGRRFHFDRHRDHYVRAHSALRDILSSYSDLAPHQIELAVAEAGKPSLAPGNNVHNIEFNLSHSGDVALVAVTRNRAVGVDVERWDSRVEFLDLADHYFSPNERASLRSLLGEQARLMHGFFHAWSRKEAYLKATGAGITNGLHYFDVTLIPEQEAALLADRNDPHATARWTMTDLQVADGYSAAVVAEAPSSSIAYFAFDDEFKTR